MMNNICQVKYTDGVFKSPPGYIDTHYENDFILFNDFAFASSGKRL
jgi:hypothetical protein